MAQYTTVVWDEGDEVTSQKLNQMAQNEQWIKDNLVAGNTTWIPNSLGQIASGREQGVLTITKMEAMEYVYDSQVPVKTFDFTVNFPPVFTRPPVIYMSLFDAFNDVAIRRLTNSRTDQCTFRIWNTDGLTKTFKGELSLLLVGT